MAAPNYSGEPNVADSSTDQRHAMTITACVSNQRPDGTARMSYGPFWSGRN